MAIMLIVSCQIVALPPSYRSDTYTECIPVLSPELDFLSDLRDRENIPLEEVCGIAS